MPASPHCRVCNDPRVAKINVLILRGTSIRALAKATGLQTHALRNHQHRHLPFLPKNRPKPTNAKEELAELKFELARLQALGEAGEVLPGAIAACRERRQLLELQMRSEGELDATHRKIMLNKAPMGDVEIVFEGGRPRSVEKAAT